MIAYVNRDDFFVVDQEFQCDAVRKIDGDRVQPLQPATQWMQSQQGMVRVHFQQLQCFEVLFFQMGIALEETHSAFVVLLGEYQREGHATDFFTRLTCATGDSFTKRPALTSVRVSAKAASSSHSRR